MPAQMIELEEVIMSEVTDDALENVAYGPTWSGECLSYGRVGSC